MTKGKGAKGCVCNVWGILLRRGWNQERGRQKERKNALQMPFKNEEGEEKFFPRLFESDRVPEPLGLTRATKRIKPKESTPNDAWKRINFITDLNFWAVCSISTLNCTHFNSIRRRNIAEILIYWMMYMESSEKFKKIRQESDKKKTIRSIVSNENLCQSPRWEWIKQFLRVTWNILKALLSPNINLCWIKQGIRRKESSI